MIWVGVGSGTAILKVAITLGRAFPWDTDRGAAVSDAVGEGVDRASLVTAGKALLVTLAVHGNMLGVAALELLDGGLDMLHTALLTHLLGGEVAVKTGTVPVAGNGLGVERDLGTELLGHTVEEEAREPEVVTHLDTLARADLVLPLSGHHLGVGARDLDAGIQAALVVSFDDVTHDNLASTDTAVVGALRSRVTVLGPAIGTVVEVEQGVLLLKTEPRLVLGVSLHQLGALVAVVVLVGGAIVVQALGKNTVYWS